MYGQMDECMTGEIGKAEKVVTRILDDNHLSFEIQDLVYGETNTKKVQVDTTRRAK